ncbi:DUF2759 domain-containing protein [Salinibacillus xinjiangensis]|uniref:DUF2759 family protein n=1 Tax=Salinibacillus xinjiangensis TaxID=1229268 RepID=A0A6G1X6Q2_9BACI|nr:DUF2759 domain-containing protein [Salinibacillus xinjiangensis]MRG86585.1 DUF2759 family protein [Salinibacillus xinjiangensis]
MVLGIMLLVVTILCAIAVFRELKSRNIFAVGFAGISVLVFGWFSVMTIVSELFPNS